MHLLIYLCIWWFIVCLFTCVSQYNTNDILKYWKPLNSNNLRCRLECRNTTENTKMSPKWVHRHVGFTIQTYLIQTSVGELILLWIWCTVIKSISRDINNGSVFITIDISMEYKMFRRQLELDVRLQNWIGDSYITHAIMNADITWITCWSHSNNEKSIIIHWL